MNDAQWFFIHGVNPEPWTASEGSVGRKGGKTFVHFHKPTQLRIYQESVADQFKEQNPHAEKVAGDIEIVFYFWRQLAEAEVAGKKRRRRAAQADATNLQKALEDALQTILYDNDRDIVSIRSMIVDQGPDVESGILIGIWTYDDNEELAWVRSFYNRMIPTQRSVSEVLPERSLDVEDVF